MEKLHEYQGWGGRIHEWRDSIREKFSNWRDEHPGTVIEMVKKATADAVRSDQDQNDYSHIYRFVIVVPVLALSLVRARVLSMSIVSHITGFVSKTRHGTLHVHYVNVGSFIQIRSQLEIRHCRCK